MTAGPWRHRLRVASLVFSGIVAAYFASVLISSALFRAALPHLRHRGGWLSGLLLGLMILDLGKLPGLALAAFVLGRMTELRPRLVAAALTLGLYALDFAAAAVFFIETRGSGATVGGRSAVQYTHTRFSQHFAWEGLLVRAVLAWLFGWAALGLLRRGQRTIASARGTPSADTRGP